MPDARPAVLVIGVGNADRGDDAVGLVVARRVRDRLAGGRDQTGLSRVAVVEHQGDGARLLDIWDRVQAVILVDAVRSGATAGTVWRLEAGEAPLPAAFSRSSSHAFGVAEAIELARRLDRLPRRVVVYGIEAASMGAGASLTPDVAAAVAVVVGRAVRDARDALAAVGPPG